MTMKKDAGKLSVQILNECPHPEVSESRLKKVAEKILRDLGFRQAEVSILLVGDKKMRAMNRQFLRHAWSTDVLAFGRGKIVKITRVKEPVRREAGNFGRYRALYPDDRRAGRGIRAYVHRGA